MPLSIRSWGPLSLEYNVAHFTWAMKGFPMQADYQFQQDGACGRKQILRHSGTIESWRVRADAGRNRNHFLHMDCKWVLLSNIERELRITVTTPQSREYTGVHTPHSKCRATLSFRHRVRAGKKKYSG